MARLDIAIIGCGAISERAHLPATAKIPSVRVTALVDTNRARAETLAARYGISQTAEEFGALRAPPQAAIVALPHHRHAPVATALLRGGVHVLVEKPLGIAVEECEELRRFVSGSQVFGVGCNRRFLPGVRATRHFLDVTVVA